MNDEAACGKKLRGRGGPECSRTLGHAGPHCPWGSEECTGKHDNGGPVAGECPGAVMRKRETSRAWREANRERSKENTRAWRAANPERHREYYRAWYEANRERIVDRNRAWRGANPEQAARLAQQRRERKASAEYLDLTALDASCYICGADNPKHIEHVVPVSRFAAYAAEASGDFVSAVRMACEACNLSKHDKSPAQYFLERWRAGMPVVQAQVVTCATCPVLALKA